DTPPDEDEGGGEHRHEERHPAGQRSRHDSPFVLGGLRTASLAGAAPAARAVRYPTARLPWRAGAHTAGVAPGALDIGQSAVAARNRLAGAGAGLRSRLCTGRARWTAKPRRGTGLRT